MEDRCSNCCSEFQKKAGGKGYYRYSLDRKFPASQVSGKEVLKDLASCSISPNKKDNFLCPQCWAILQNAYKYRQYIEQFYQKTHDNSYLGGRLEPSNVEKTSTDNDPLPSSSKVKLPTKALFSPKKTKPIGSKWETIIKAIRARHYKRAIKGLYQATPGTQKHFMSFVKDLIRKEVKQLLKSDISLCKEVNMLNLETFGWDKVFVQLSELAPVLKSVLCATVTTKRQDDFMYRGKRRVINLKPRAGNALAQLLYAKSPRKSRFIQTVTSIQLWRGGLKREFIDQLSHIGLCLGLHGTENAIDRIRTGFDAAALSSKSQLEKQLSEGEVYQAPSSKDHDFLKTIDDVLSSTKNIEEEMEVEYEKSANPDTEVELTDSEEDVDVDDDDVDTVMDESDSADNMDVESDEPVSPQGASVEPLHPGFTFCWDNVGKKVTTRYPTSETSNTYLNFALAYIAINRVPSTHLDSHNTISEDDIPMDVFIPTVDDWHELRERMNVVVSRILVQHLQWFKEHFSDCPVRHIIHAHSMESAQKSVLVNLGVFEEDPSSTNGAIGIYDRLHKYVPDIDGVPHPTLVFGDGMSCERGCSAKRARHNGPTPQIRLEAMQPAAQEFHKEMLLLQDHYDEFFKGASGDEKGTLFHAKNMCHFRNVKGDISDNFSQAWELMTIQTEALVTAIALQILQMKATSDRPSDAPVDIEEDSKAARQTYLKELSSRITALVWHDMNTDLLKVQASGEDDPSLYCCKEDLDENFIGCEMRSQCLHGHWFHYSCAKVDGKNIPEKWFCSDECKNNTALLNESCYCRRKLDIPMVGCSAENRCTGYDWYHCKCLGIDPAKLPKGKWYCSERCRTEDEQREPKKKGKKRKRNEKEEASSPDHKYQYSNAMAWSGLNLLCRRDAVREGDGEAMMSHWAIDLVRFYANRHYKYVILAHRLKASLNGWLPENLVHDLIWNRTVNYSGGIGRNLPHDLTNELLNRLYKESSKDNKGHYTSITIARTSQMVGPLGEALDAVVDSKVMENDIYRHRRRSVNRDKNVADLLKVLAKEKLFEVIPGRHHNSFPSFTHNETPRNAGSFLQKMKQLNDKLTDPETIDD